MEDAIQKAKHQIADIRKQQKVQFEAYLAIDETASGLPTISEKQEVLPKLGGLVWKGYKREELWPNAAHNQTKTAHDPDKTPQMEEEQVGSQYEQADTVTILHKRVEALRSLRSLASRHAKAGASQASLLQEAWSVDESPGELGPQAYRNAWMSAAVINELLSENVEKQRVTLAGLKRSKEEILKIQEEIARDGELDEKALQQWNVDVERFLKEREVTDWRGDE